MLTLLVISSPRNWCSWGFLVTAPRGLDKGFVLLLPQRPPCSCQCPWDSSPERASWGLELQEEALDMKNFILLFFSAGEGVSGPHGSLTEEL